MEEDQPLESESSMRHDGMDEQSYQQMFQYLWIHWEPCKLEMIRNIASKD